MISLNEYRAMAAAEESHWWYRFLHHQVISVLRRYARGKSFLRLADAGCGTGGLLSRLESRMPAVEASGFDLSDFAVDLASRRTGARVFTGDIAGMAGYYPPKSLDVICSLDTLYFFPPEEMEEILTNFFNLLVPGGVALLNLPAGPAFAGTHDLAVGIRRRFTKKSILPRARAAGFIPARCFFWPCFLSVPILLFRTFERITLALGGEKTIPPSDLGYTSPPLDRILFKLLKAETLLPDTLRFFGSSLFLVLQKP